MSTSHSLSSFGLRIPPQTCLTLALACTGSLAGTKYSTAAALAVVLAGTHVAGSRLDGLRTNARQRSIDSQAPLAHPPGARPATTTAVGNCADGGSGSLRAAVAGAVAGDTIDLRQLSCSRITLITGAISTSVTDLTLLGPGASALAIDGDVIGGNHNRVFTHQGTGTFTIKGLTITDAEYQGNATSSEGGCVSSDGSVTLMGSTVSNCTVVGQATSEAHGGGVFAQKDVTLIDSAVIGNYARSTGAYALGGGIYAKGKLTVTNSSIDGNKVLGVHSFGGGLDAGSQTVTIVGSTISRNQAEYGGGAFLRSGVSSTASIVNSTISGNIASLGKSGVDSYLPLTLSNSTIAFNQAGTDTYAAGLYIGASTADLESSIIADNTGIAGHPSDISGIMATITGTHNLITSSSNVTLPAQTLTACPKLGPLANNGGATWTHALLHTSPAINMGTDTLSLTDDQRGMGFPRVFGATADIGAFEWQGITDDRIFTSGFELACDH